MEVVTTYKISSQDLNDLLYAINFTIEHSKARIFDEQIIRLKQIQRTLESSPKYFHSDEYLIKKLSNREFEIYSLLMKGIKNKEIASFLEISENTVKAHIKKVYSKLGVATRIELMRHYRHSNFWEDLP